MVKVKRKSWDLEKVKRFVEVESNSGVKLISDSYKNTHSVLILKCPCGNEFERKFTKFYHAKQRNCKECSWKRLGDARRKPHDQFVKEAYEVHGSEYTILSKYVRLKDKILVRHNSPVCNYREYKVDADSFLHGGRGCQECYFISNRGSGNPSWNPELTDEERLENRDYPEYRQWRNAVYERDDYTCQCCGIKGRKLNAHHIFNFSQHKELRTEVDNGITLCVTCHRTFHKTYGMTGNDSEQLSEFLESHETEKELA